MDKGSGRKSGLMFVLYRISNDTKMVVMMMEKRRSRRKRKRKWRKRKKNRRRRRRRIGRRLQRW